MKDQDKDSRNKRAELRRRAELAAAEKSSGLSDVSALSPEKVQQLIHELQVHQIELEMQHEELRRTQQDLDASRDKYAELYDFAPVGYVTLNEKGLILEANLTAVRLLGGEGQSLTKMFFSRFVCQEFGDAFYLYLQLVLETQLKQTCEIKLARKDGTHFLAQLESVAVQDEYGQFNRCRTIVSDITERKKAEEALREISSRQGAILAAVPDIIMEVDKNKVYTWANPAGFGFFGEDVIGKEAAFYFEGEQETYATIDPLFNGDDNVIYLESRQRRRDGQKRLLAWWCRVLKDGNGEVKGALSSARDVTDRRNAEEALFASKRDWEDAFNSIDDMITIHDKDYNIIHYNTAAKRLLGLPNLVNSEVMKCFQYYHGRDCPPETCPSCRCLRTQEQAIFEVFEPHLNMFVEIRAIPRFDGYGQLTGLVHIVRDITDRRKMDVALKEIQGQQKALLDNIPDIAWLKDKESRYIAVNQPFGEACGVASENLRGKTDLDIWPFELAERYRADDRDVMASGRRKRVEEPLTDKDGNTIWTETIKTPIYNDVGENIGTAGIARDITERKRAEEALRLSEERYRRLFEAAPLMYVITRNKQGVPFVVECNQFFLRSLGYTREEVQGKALADFYSPESRAELLERGGYARALGGEFFMGERELVRSDGSLLTTLLYTATEVGPSGQVIGTRAMFVDITERRRAELEKETLSIQLLQAQKMESIGTMAGGIAHDFNNLLTVILGFSEWLVIGKDARDPSYADLQKIIQAARNGADLVKRILMFSRQAEINARPLNLNHEIEQAKKLLTRTIPKMIEIELILSDDPATVNADPTQIEQILINLAVNAKDAMPEGGKLTIETKRITLDEQYCGLHAGAKPGDYVLLSVSDTGHGMDHETLNHIFEPFYTTKEAGKGTGLGLAMVYGIVKQHDGYIMCYSEPGMGTTFKIYLPVVPTEAKSEAPTEKPTLQRGTETILLVDDEEMIRELGKRILERSGYTVLTASNGKEALNQYGKQSGRISLVILDLIMPEMGGKQCLEELLKTDPKVKVLIASGYSQVGETKKTIEAGVRGFVGKPYDIRQILQVVRQVLDQD